MKFKSLVYAQASGSVGGLTYSHNKGGMYTRSRGLVITPKTSYQLAAQNAIRTLSDRWQTLTALQRAGWKTYATNVPILNTLGDSRIIPELAMYIRCNSPRLQFIGATAIVDTAPTTYALGTLTTPVLTAVHPHGDSIAYTNTDAWATADGGYLFIQGARPVTATRIFPKGRFRFAGSVAGATAVPPTSPAAITHPFDYVAGNLVRLICRASLADGRLTSPQTIQAIAT